jgi:hypothetical protein
MKSTKCWQSSRLKGKAPAPSSAPIWLQTAHAKVVADQVEACEATARPTWSNGYATVERITSSMTALMCPGTLLESIDKEVD